MRLTRRILLIVATVFFVAVAAVAWSADFTQVERTAEFSTACRRQDKKLADYFAEMIPGGTAFHTQGGFRVLVHRDGLMRTAKLIPVRSIRFPDFTAFQEAARKKHQIIGVLITTYTHPDPFIVPGTHLITYDGYQAHIIDHHGYEQAAVKSELGDVPAEPELDPVVGSITTSSASLTNLTPAGDLQFYLQFARADGKALTNADGEFQKCLLTIPLPGFVTDDDSLPRNLATPPDNS